MANQCTCIADTEKAIVEQLLSDSRNPQGYEVVNSEWEHVSIFPTERMYSVLLVRSRFTKKDGTPSTVKTKSVNIFHSYCCFCGKEINTHQPTHVRAKK